MTRFFQFFNFTIFLIIISILSRLNTCTRYFYCHIFSTRQCCWWSDQFELPRATELHNEFFFSLPLTTQCRMVHYACHIQTKISFWLIRIFAFFTLLFLLPFFCTLSALYKLFTLHVLENFLNSFEGNLNSGISAHHRFDTLRISIATVLFSNKMNIVAHLLLFSEYIIQNVIRWPEWWRLWWWSSFFCV